LTEKVDIGDCQLVAAVSYTIVDTFAPFEELSSLNMPVDGVSSARMPPIQPPLGSVADNRFVRRR